MLKKKSYKMIIFSFIMDVLLNWGLKVKSHHGCFVVQHFLVFSTDEAKWLSVSGVWEVIERNNGPWRQIFELEWFFLLSQSIDHNPMTFSDQEVETGKSLLGLSRSGRDPVPGYSRLFACPIALKKISHLWLINGQSYISVTLDVWDVLVYPMDPYNSQSWV